MYMARLTKNVNFGPKISCYGPKLLFLLVCNGSKKLKVFSLMNLMTFADLANNIGKNPRQRRVFLFGKNIGFVKNLSR